MNLQQINLSRAIKRAIMFLEKHDSGKSRVIASELKWAYQLWVKQILFDEHEKDIEGAADE